eukprot:3503761-Amphidinium_carterae.1
MMLIETVTLQACARTAVHAAVSSRPTQPHPMGFPGNRKVQSSCTFADDVETSLTRTSLVRGSGKTGSAAAFATQIFEAMFLSYCFSIYCRVVTATSFVSIRVHESFASMAISLLAMTIPI